MRLENGKKLVITRDSDKPYIQSVTLNGKPLMRSYITYEEIAAGGELSFVMDSKPGSEWGVGKDRQPVTKIDNGESIVPVPVFSTDKVSFQDRTRIALRLPEVVEMASKRESKPVEKEVKKEMESSPKLQVKPANAYEIYYTTDGSTPTPKTGIRYKDPIVVEKDVTIKAVAVDAKGTQSKVAEARYVRYTRDKDLTYITKPEPQYYAGGDAGLIDNSRGKVNYRIGGWQGFTKDCELVVDLRESKKVSEVGAGVLEEQRAWIFYPTAMEVYVSENGKDYTLFGKESFNVQRTDGAHLQDIRVQGKANARYVKIIIRNYGKLPEWHLSAGQQAWLFVDEVWVR